MTAWLSNLWRIPGRAWAAALAAANITLWWRFGAVVITTAIVVGLILVIWLGPWTLDVERARLDWLGWFGMAAWFVVLVCIVALMDFRLNFRASRQGIEANMAGDEHDPPAPLTVETTTKTTVGGAAAGAAPTAPEPADDTPPWERKP